MTYKLLKKTLLLGLILLFSAPYMGQTMTFNTGATEPGFTFGNWGSGGGTIWVGNLAFAATVTKNTGTWNFISFEVGPFLGINNMQVTSDLGHSYNYSTATAGVHTLNWIGVTTVTFTRTSGSGISADHDNFVYGNVCNNPDVPTVTIAPDTVCHGDSAIISISGQLNDATAWHVYSDSCGGNKVGSTPDSTLKVVPTSEFMFYYVRGEDGPGCVDDTSGVCGFDSTYVFRVDTALTHSGQTITASASPAQYQWIDCNNGNVAIPGATDQDFTPSSNGSYAVIVTENGCQDTSACVDITGVGVRTTVRNEFSVYPNPTYDFISLELPSTAVPARVIIKSLDGREIFQQTLNTANRWAIPIKGAAGIYVMQIIEGDGTSSTIKVIKR